MNTFSVLLQKNCTLSIICKDPNEETEEKIEESEEINTSKSFNNSFKNINYSYNANNKEEDNMKNKTF